MRSVFAAACCSHSRQRRRATGTTQPQRPNIVLMFADNLGWGEVVPMDPCAACRRRTSTALARKEFG
jgi:hypothetical protein